MASTYMTIAFCVICIINTAGITGNFLVIISFIQNHRMRIVRNYYLVCLSGIDLGIGLFSVPLYLHTLLGYDWPYGYAVCITFVSIDSWLSSASCLCGVMITYDRYSMVKDALAYIHKHTPQRAMVLSILACFVALVLRVPVSVYGSLSLGSAEEICGYHSEYEVPYSHGARKFDVIYTLSSSMVDFVIPVVIIVYCNINVYRFIHRHQRKLSMSRSHKSSSCGSNNCSAQEGAVQGNRL